MTIEQLELEVRAALPLIGEGKRAIVGGREVFDEADLEAAVRAANSFHKLGMELDPNNIEPDPTSQGEETAKTEEAAKPGEELEPTKASEEPTKAPEESTESVPAEAVTTPEVTEAPEATATPEVTEAPAPKRGR